MEECRFTAHVTDAWCAWNNGAFLFESKNGKLKVSKVEKNEETFELTISGLSALVFYGICARYDSLHSHYAVISSCESGEIQVLQFITFWRKCFLLQIHIYWTLSNVIEEKLTTNLQIYMFLVVRPKELHTLQSNITLILKADKRKFGT